MKNIFNHAVVESSKNPPSFYMRFGTLGDSVSRIGLGTVKIGRNQKVKNACGDNFELPSDAAVDRLLTTCLEQGINLIDTAPAYGSSEERLGGLLRERRDKFFLVSKTGEEFEEGVSRYDYSFEHTVRSVERSLVRLKTSYLDCVLVHAHAQDQEIISKTEVLPALAKLKEQGKIRSFGVSTMTVEGGLLAASLCDVVMVSYNAGFTQHLPVIDAARCAQKAVLIKKGLGSGFASKDGKQDEFLKALAELSSSATIIGTTNAEHLEHNTRQFCRYLS